jgi:hypothetical protein
MKSPHSQTVVAMATYATDLAHAYPGATSWALADKLLTVFQDTPRALRLEVAEAALANVQGPAPLMAAE